MSPQIERARLDDLSAVAGLLAACGLPTEDIGEHFDHFLVARSDGALCAAGGLEFHGAHALLRSVAVQPAWRGIGAARAVCQGLLAAARQRGCSRVYLLTTTAESFFVHLGFKRVARDALPAEIRATREFTELCPQTAIAMMIEP